MKNLKAILLLIVIGLTVSFCLSAATSCLAASNVTDLMRNSISNVNLPEGGSDPEAKALTIVGRAIGVFLGILGVVFLVLMVYGGFRWFNAMGREEEIATAKRIFNSSILGLIIIMLSYAIAYWVTTSLEKSIR